ncbi:TonB-dependent receptor plug domain-containing protein [Rhodovulum sulfidophilum]|uniref:TonB-dependent receptor plug domain-containing protein n=1 Tax=Rhodovulum sulfidophilum TaxID=35806 RepID=UPI0013897E4A|nr:TonB-dependent receptor [Rhodovulum sulfidophilum]NDK33994.1 TonB-dependent receptor [Rhodovulum sulfidophilum]
MTRSSFCFGLGLATLAPLHALAEDLDDSLLLDEITASASLTPVATNRTGATVETLDRDQIAAGGQNLGETLATLPGVTIAQYGGLGQLATLHIRGLNNGYIATRIDGMDFSDPTGIPPSLQFGTLTPGLASRIEVLKGSQSALYGANAIGGVIDMTSWRPDRPGLSGRAEVEAGTYGTYSGTLSFGNMTDRGQIALTMSHVETHGFSSQDGNRESDGFDQDLILLSAEFDATEQLTLGFSALYSDSKTDYDNDATDTSPVTASTETRKGVRVFAGFDIGTVENELAFAWTQTERGYNAPGWGRSSLTGKRRTLSYLGSADLTEAARLSFGADWSEQEADLSSGNFNTESTAVFGELQYALSNAADLSFSLRHDDHSDFDNQTTGRLALAWRLEDDLILRAVLGTGYLTPSLYQRFDRNYGNPDIKPESSRSAELGLEKRFGRDGFVKATLFHTEIDDLIDSDKDTYVTKQISGTTTSKGIELSARHALSQTAHIFGNYTYTDSRGSKGRSTHVPRHDLMLGIDTALGDRANARLTLQRSTDSVDSDGALDDYTLAGAMVSYALTDSSEAYLRVENLFNDDYQTFRGYNTSGRALYVGLRASF